MAELSQQLRDEIDGLVAAGDGLLNSGQYDEAMSVYRRAWESLPDPKDQWDDSARLLAAIGDAQFFNGEFAGARETFMAIVRDFASADNPYLRLRLGQCLFELREMPEAANWLAGAFLLARKRVFAQEDPKYLTWIKSQLKPPPGGWPDGW